MNELVTQETRSIAPAANVLEESGKVVVHMEMPGVSKDGLEIEVKGQELSIVGRREESALEGRWLIRERRRGDFRKTYAVDGSIDLEQVDAQLADGILKLTLPLKEAAKPRKIDIRSAS